MKRFLIGYGASFALYIVARGVLSANGADVNMLTWPWYFFGLFNTASILLCFWALHLIEWSKN